ncbi:MAG: IS200/IS605 family transposase [Candidatus Marinimicrobia bacterium]|nr:IS200/IS605 family transposase [Candidatus Neomarinimicrobiota bacterium]MCF7829876.1 IS200/IS605 family transposase [Candidatus Neomarinimicrobiota bacterium]MCF7879161.1 IS200/IS605 family transposase [Candidatus Neomarinimicrobiota bacterium]
MSNNRTELFYHLVWHTKDNEPYLDRTMESIVYPYIRRRVDESEGNLLRINGTENHVHILISIPPNKLVSEFIRKIKASSATYINKNQDIDGYLYWQRGYGAFTVSKQNLKAVANYIERQKHHHKTGTLKSDWEV